MPLVPIEVSAIPNGWDYLYCNERWGSQLRLSECEHAASHLPVGDSPVLYKLNGPRPFTFPWQQRVGSCRVTVQLAGPWSDALTQINIIPNSIRVAAGGVLDECVEDDPNHLGGYVTNNFRQLRNYVSSPLTNLTGEWPRYLDPPLIFFTVTIDGGDGPLNSPGDYDEMPPKMLARNLGDKQREAKGTPLEQHYRDGVRQYLGYAVQARVSGYTNRWWSPAQNSIAADNMAYECDADLGTPNSTECSQIEYSQLGAAGDKITIGPGNPKVLSSSTCNVAITSAMLIVITWAQVKAALDELIDLCGSNPQQGAVGGKAYYGTTVTPSLGIMGRQVSGLNALPPHVNLTMYSSGRFTP